MNELIPWVQNWIGLEAEPIITFITDWGGPLGWFITLQLVFVLGGIARGLRLTALATLALLTNDWLKWIIAEPRPYLIDDAVTALSTTTGWGMPSGHAQGGIAIWGGMAWLFQHKKFIVALFILLALATGLSRIYLGVHSPAQVFAGMAIGLIILTLILIGWNKLCVWFASLSWRACWFVFVTAILIAIGITELIAVIYGAYVVPQAWLEIHANITGAESATAQDLGLTQSSTHLLILLMAGYFSIGIFDRRWSAEIITLSQRFLCIIPATLLNIGFIYSLPYLVSLESVALVGLTAILQPIICIYLPMRLMAMRLLALR